MRSLFDLRRIVACLLSLMLVDGSEASAAPADCEWFFRDRNVEYRRQQNGWYFFTDTSVTWVPDNPRRPVRFYGYILGNYGHRAALRRQIGEARFQQVLAALHPERAAEEALGELRLAVKEAAVDKTELVAIEDIAAKIQAIPLDEEIPPLLWDSALVLFQQLGFYASTLNDYLALNSSRFPYLGEDIEIIKATEITVIAGNVSDWRGGAEGQTKSIVLMERKAQLEEEMDRSRPYMVVHHTDLIRLAQEVFGPDRVVFQYDPMGDNFHQTWRGGNSVRAVSYYPSFISLFPERAYVQSDSRIESSPERPAVHGHWIHPDEL